MVTLRFEDERRRNPLGRELLEALTASLESLAEEPELRAVVIGSAGSRAFCAGADLEELRALGPATAEPFIRRIHRLCATVRSLPVPVVARIQGPCLGAGLELACSCDLRVAGEAATFAMPEVRVGIPSVIEAALLPRLIGAGRARDLVLTGRSLTAAEAERWGLVDRCVPDDELDAAVDAVVAQLLAASPRALRLQKSLCRQWEEVPLVDAVEAGVRSFGEAWRDGEPARWLRPRGRG